MSIKLVVMLCYVKSIIKFCYIV